MEKISTICNAKLLYSFQIFFPTETRVDITWSIGLFNVDITASVHDYMKTRGLCGNLSDTCTDDFLLKDNTSSTTHIHLHECNKAVTSQRDSPSDFITSWGYALMLISCLCTQFI